MKKYFFFFVSFCNVILAIDQAELPVDNRSIKEELRTFEVGQVFSMNFLLRGYDQPWETIETGEMVPPVIDLIRSFSNYGFESLEPNESAKYVVESITKKVPNSRAPRERVLIVRQIEPAQTSTQRIFWHINSADGLIESSEAGDWQAVLIGLKAFSRG